MATKANTSSVDTKQGDKLATFGAQKIATMRASYSPEEKKIQKQIVNARKLHNLDAIKTKARRKAKIAKASKRKNKK